MAAPPPPEPIEAEFTRVGRYLLSPRIASGGMATVHVARPISVDGLARTVAVKRLHSHLATDTDIATMLRDEARLSMRIQHANVAAVLDVVELKGELLLVMEYVAGTSLADIMQTISAGGRRLPFEVTSAIMAGALHGLQAAHEARDANGEALGVVHRDFSPHNLLLGAEGVPKVTDFGVAKSKGRLRTTRDGLVRGKLGYMAPEQVRAGELTRRVDIFGAGVILWEMLVGRPLFDGEAEAEIMYKVLEAPIPNAAEVAPDVPAELARIAEVALDRDPGRRFQTAREMALAIEKAGAVASTTRVGGLVETLLGERLHERTRLIRALEQASTRALSEPPDATPTKPVVPPPSFEVSFHDEARAAAARAQIDEAVRGPGTRNEVVRRPLVKDKSKEGGVLGPLLLLVVIAGLAGVGFIYRAELAPVVDAPQTAPLAFQCLSENEQACHDLATRYESGEGAPIDRYRAAELYGRACDKNHSDSCIRLAGLMAMDDTPEAIEKRFALLEAACEGGNQTGCTALGRALIERSGEADLARGIELMATACDDYFLDACTELGVLYLEGKLLAADPAKAAALCQKACDRGDRLACSCAAKVRKGE
jgi:eukaryotic-like serine/threonine-protein kinase